MINTDKLAEALRRLVNTFPIPVDGVEQADRSSLRLALFAAREALAAHEAAARATAPETGDTNGRHDGLRPDLHGRVLLGGHTPGALADLLWASDDVMALNAELGLTMDRLVQFAQAVLAAAKAEPAGEAASSESPQRKAERPTRAARKVNVSTDLASPCGSDSSDLLGFNAEASPRVLDPASGSRMMWFDRGHPDVVFGDKRRETVTVTDRSHGRADGTRTLTVDPDMLMDFRALPFNDGTFRLVAFDPPHLVRAGPRSWLAAKYGKLGQDWRDDLRQGFAECFRVLHPHGVLVFKWNETQVKLSEVLALVPHAPLFGNTSGKKAGTHWLVFMKPTMSGKSSEEAVQTTTLHVGKFGRLSLIPESQTSFLDKAGAIKS